MSKQKTKQLVLLKASDPFAGDDRYGAPKLEKFDIKMLCGNTIYNYKNCYVKSMNTQLHEQTFDTHGFSIKSPGLQGSEITIGSDYFTIDCYDYAEVERFNKMFDLNINATNELSDKDKPKVVEKIVEKEVVKVEYVNVVVVPPTYKEIITEKYDFYKKLL